VWPLLKALVAEGLSAHIAISLDLATASMWRHYGGQVGPIFLPQQIVARLRAEGYPETIIHQLTAQNIASRLAPNV
jgi:predicted metal-dependent phosphotriesterase family hydrolase